MSAPAELSGALPEVVAGRPVTRTCGVDVSHISSVLSLQGRSRRNAQRQLDVIRRTRAQQAEAARALVQQQADEAAPVPGTLRPPW